MVRLDALDVREVFLVHVNNWFDHKWLGWRSWSEGELCVPSFDPHRVRSEKRFIRDEDWRGMDGRRVCDRELHRFRARPRHRSNCSLDLIFEVRGLHLVQRE